MIRKTLMLFTFMAVALLALAAPPQAAGAETVTLDIPGMSCRFCPITIRKALRKVPGVIRAEASLDTKTATITFDPAKTGVEALIEATTNAGYPSTLRK